MVSFGGTLGITVQYIGSV